MLHRFVSPRRLIACLFVLGLATTAASPSFGAGEPLGSGFAKVQNQVLNSARERGASSMAVLIRLDRRSRPEPRVDSTMSDLLGHLRQGFATTPIVVHLLDADPENPVRGAISEEEAERTRIAAETDLLLVGDYLKSSRGRRLRISLFSAEKEEWTATLRLPREIAMAPLPPRGIGAPVRMARSTQCGAGAACGANGGSAADGRALAQAIAVGNLQNGGGIFGAAGVNGGGAVAVAPQPGQNGNAAAGEQNGEVALGAGGRNGNPLNAGVLRFAEENIGRQVGNGECWTLAADALRAAGAAPPNLYDFGQEIRVADIIPGDILQFTSVRIDNPNGSYFIMGIPNHTAIVRATRGSVVTVLHQNFGSRIVTQLTFDLNDVTRGRVEAFRPVAANGTNQQIPELGTGSSGRGVGEPPVLDNTGLPELQLEGATGGGQEICPN